MSVSLRHGPRADLLVLGAVEVVPVPLDSRSEVDDILVVRVGGVVLLVLDTIDGALIGGEKVDALAGNADLDMTLDIGSEDLEVLHNLSLRVVRVALCCSPLLMSQ